MAGKAFIAGLSGTGISADERSFFGAQNPWGYILFARNVDTPEQLRALTAELRAISGRNDVPILIDQEGGRVQRLRPPHWNAYPTGAALGALYARDPASGLRAAWAMSRLHAHDLLALGINVDCLPVLDVPSPEGHDVIGDRAYGDTPDQVTALGRAAAEGLMAGGVLPVIKHIPGHGRATADSHMEMPVVTTDRETLEAVDFAPFRALADMPMAMTAHVVYTALDADQPATTSPSIIADIIRGHMGFDGLLMSDDVTMKALSGNFGERSRAIIEAGCDVVLHCNGDLEEMRAVADAVPELSGEAARRADHVTSLLGGSDDTEESALRAEFAELMRSDEAVA